MQFNPPPPGAPQRGPGLRVNVYLPDGYDGERRFPVLYLLHDLDGTFESWAAPSHGDLMRVAQGFPGIIVMPEGAPTGMPTGGTAAPAAPRPGSVTTSTS